MVDLMIIGEIGLDVVKTFSKERLAMFFGTVREDKKFHSVGGFEHSNMY